MIIHINYLRIKYRHMKEIGLTWDKAIMRHSDEVKQHMENMNLEGPLWMHLAFMDAGLTLIQSLPDVAIIKPIKKECRLGHQRVLFGRRGETRKDTNFHVKRLQT